MPSSPLGSTEGRTASGVACHHRLWPAHTVKRRRVWYAIIALGKHTGSNDVRRCMPSSPLSSTHGRTTWGVARHHRLWKTHTVGNVKCGMMTSPPLDRTQDRQYRVWHDITALGQHTTGNVGRGMTSPPLDNTHGRQRRAWHDITALGQHTRLATSGGA